MEITLGKEVYYHGESVSVGLVVTNNSRKTVKNLKVLDTLNAPFISVCLFHLFLPVIRYATCRINHG